MIYVVFGIGFLLMVCWFVFVVMRGGKIKLLGLYLCYFGCRWCFDWLVKVCMGKLWWKLGSYLWILVFIVYVFI